MQDRERESCGCSDEVIIKSTKSKAAKYFQPFLQNGENKNKLVDLLCETTSSSPDRALVILQTSVICFSKEDSYVRVRASQVTIVDGLSSNQEKAENKVIVYSAHAIKTTEGLIILRSFSGETDIMIIAISHIDNSKHVNTDYGNGKNR